MEPDDELVARARSGDDDAFQILWERHHRTVYRFVYAMTGEHARAEDLVQETFIAAHRGLRALRGESRFSTWLCAIARNRTAKAFRVSTPSTEDVPLSVPDGGTPEAQLLDAEVQRAVSRALLQLDEAKRTVFTLKLIQGFSYEEIAAVTGETVSKLKTDLFRARTRMRELLAGYREGRR